MASVVTAATVAFRHLWRRRKPRLVYAARSRCKCGAGLAYDPRGASGKPIGGYWDCSDILLGVAIPSGEPGSVQHSDRFPFVFYEIKGENQPSARGETTRPEREPPRAFA